MIAEYERNPTSRNRRFLCHKYWPNICSAIFQPIEFFIMAYVKFKELAGRPYFSSRLGRDFSVHQAFFCGLGPNQSRIQYVARAFTPKQSGRGCEAECLPPSVAAAKNASTCRSAYLSTCKT